MSDTRPIGMFDSGVGGLTVLERLHRDRPGERLLYIADLAHFPYGPRYQHEVREFALRIVEHLVAADCKLVVVACNTATAAALNTIRERFDVPVVGVIAPGAQAAVDATVNGRVAVISTEGTRASQEYVHAVREANPGVGVLSVAAPELVDIVEDGGADSRRAELAVAPLIDEVLGWGADTLVLGCTHYPLLRSTIGRVLDGRPLTVVDSAETTAARVARILAVNRLESAAGDRTTPVLQVTADPGRFAASAALLFGGELPDPELIPLWESLPVSGGGAMSIVVDELLAPIADDLLEFERRLAASVAADLGPMADAMEHIVRAGGKRLRPALVLLTSGLGTPDRDHAFNLAMGIEFIHTATLVHDDLIDNAGTRRGITTVHETVGANPAIIIGDYYFAKGANLLSSIGEPSIDMAISNTVMTICMGELLQLTSHRDYDQTLEEYHRKIARKTATLLETCCHCGAVVGRLDERHTDALRQYGHLLGMAYQIADDLLDYTATSEQLGKPVGADLRQGTVTLPLMLALQDPPTAPRLRHLIDNEPLDDAAYTEIVELVRSSPAIAATEEQAHGFVVRAREQLEIFEPSPERDTLIRVCDYVVDRRT